MSLEAPGSESIMVLSLRQSEHTNHTLDRTIFFTEFRSTALLTCWQVNPVKITMQSKYTSIILRMPYMCLSQILEYLILSLCRHFSCLPLTSSDDSSSLGFRGLFVRLVISAAFKEKGSLSRIWSSGWEDRTTICSGPFVKASTQIFNSTNTG